MKGKEFGTFEEGKDFIRSHCIENNIKFYCERSNKDERYYIKCKRSSSCSFRIHLFRNKNGKVSITEHDDSHVCIPFFNLKRNAAANSLYLSKIVPKHMSVEERTKNKAISQCIEKNINQKVTKRVVQLTKDRILENSLKEENETFRLLPGILESIKENNPGSVAKMVIRNGEFLRMFIMYDA